MKDIGREILRILREILRILWEILGILWVMVKIACLVIVLWLVFDMIAKKYQVAPEPQQLVVPETKGENK